MCVFSPAVTLLHHITFQHSVCEHFKGTSQEGVCTDWQREAKSRNGSKEIIKRLVNGRVLGSHTTDKLCVARAGIPSAFKADPEQLRAGTERLWP